MMFIAGQSNRIWHYWAGKYPGSVGVMAGPSYFKKVPLDRWMPFVLDNDAFTCWRDQKPWDVEAWRKMLRYVRMTGLKPLWATVPDVVADRRATLLKWEAHKNEILDLGWPAAFVVQDGMTPTDVPEEASVIFVGGSDRWKFPNLKMWTDAFPCVHCARVTAPEMFEACEKLGCESIDATGWFRDPSRQDKLPAVQRFIEGYRNKTPSFV